MERHLDRQQRYERILQNRFSCRSRKRLVALSITHNSGCDFGTEFDVGQAG